MLFNALRLNQRNAKARVSAECSVNCHAHIHVLIVHEVAARILTIQSGWLSLSSSMGIERTQNTSQVSEGTLTVQSSSKPRLIAASLADLDRINRRSHSEQPAKTLLTPWVDLQT